MYLMRTITFLALVFSLTAYAADNVAPFHAEYNVLRNGKIMGHAIVNLRDLGNGQWELATITKGTDGMAKLLGLNVQETSRFRWREELPEGLIYHYSQEAAIKSRQRQVDFNWQHNLITVQEDKDSWNYPTQSGVMDRHSVTLALAAKLKQEAKNFALLVAVKDRIETQHFAVATTEQISVPAGQFTAQRIDRQDKGRSQRSWFALDRYLLPVQIEQTDSKGDMVIMQLVTLLQK